MSFITKLNRLSGKLKLAIVISVLWFLFWVIAGWEGEEFLAGLAFGGIPLIIIWGFGVVAIWSYQEVDFKKKLQDCLEDDAQRKREYIRLEYPPAKRPILKFGENELEIIDISEKGLKLLNDKQFDLSRSIHGKVVLLSGMSIYVDGEVAWSLNNEVGMLMALIPSSIIAEERRFLPD